MGGQACVFYGAAQFSRDVDFAVLCDVENLQRLQQALHELDAERVAVPPLEADYLRRGHAVHFRCRSNVCGISELDRDLRCESGNPVAALSVFVVPKSRGSSGDRDFALLQFLSQLIQFTAPPINDGVWCANCPASGGGRWLPGWRSMPGCKGRSTG